jgi:esterase/lipase superfamily enzyme
MRLAQIVWDVNYKGVPVLFSWPSLGAVSGYEYDRQSALIARQPFLKIISLIQNAGISEIYVLAHSMGNQIVLDGMASVSERFKIAPVTELILAAPDVDQDWFRIALPEIRRFTAGMTLYASSADRALIAVRQLSVEPRVGEVSNDGPFVVEGLDTIDATALGDDPLRLNHDTFASARSLIDDIGRLINSGARPPNVRTPQLRGMPEGSSQPKYWKFPR